MDIRRLEFSGVYEEQSGPHLEELQIMTPGTGLERDLLKWILLAHPQTVGGDPARQGYVIHYELGGELDRGIFILKITGRDASQVQHAVEIAAALTCALPSASGRAHTFIPLWFLSEAIHFKPIEGLSHDQYHGAAYGHLRFDASATLPHRRLFGAAI